MLILLHYAWPWILLGAAIILVSLRMIGIAWRDWLSVLLNMPFMLFTDNTHQEKVEAKQPIETAIDANPGCFILLFGVVVFVFGIGKWILG